ncbi:hypothetical protein F5Y12DRAFT_711430 [Xylaria sp. FL1777]|nr:hypothetical protein F5Y12DRAFT_711430 [Xylaria sp. FL1777]
MAASQPDINFLTPASLYQSSYLSTSSDAIRYQSCRASFSRNYSCSYTARERKVVYNWNARGYDPADPCPPYRTPSLAQDTNPEKGYLRLDTTQNTKLNSTKKLYSESKGKGKAVSQETYGSRDANYPTADLNQRIDTWLQGGESSKSMDRKWHEDSSQISETPSVNTFQISPFDRNGVENDMLDTDPYSQPAPANPNLTLPCEFKGYDACEQVFDIDAVDDWIEHTVSDHLKGNIPSKCVCWFCDDVVFCSDNDLDPRTSFNRRMWHIREHILEGMNSELDMRPDYYLLDHVYRHKLISTDVYNVFRRYSEIPKPDHIRSFDFVLPEAERYDEISNRIIVDQAKEDRVRRRHSPRCKEETVEEFSRTKKIRKIHALNSSVSDTGPQFKPPQLECYEEAQSKADIQPPSEGGERNATMGLYTPDCVIDQIPFTTDNKTQHFKNNLLYSLDSKTHLTSMYNNFVPSPSHQGSVTGNSLLASISASASNTGKGPKIAYGLSIDRSAVEVTRSCSPVSISTAGYLRQSPRTEQRREKKTWPNIFIMVTYWTRIPLSKVFARLRRLFWPKRPHHLLRISWICRCGQPLYIDVHPARRQIAIEYAQAASGSASSITVSGTSTSANSPTQTFSSASSPTTQSGAGIFGTTEPIGVQPSGIFTPPVLAPGTKKYLCSVLIRNKYESMRGPLIKNIFMAPKTVEYIKFELVRRSSTGECVGNYERNCIPSQTEVEKKEYTFSPCPPRIGAMPVQPHVFMHSFLNPGDHLGELAVLQLPKKVGKKLKCVTQPHDPIDIPYGWGIYIVEGLNTLLVSLVLAGVLALVTLIVLLWGALKSDVQGATGIGQYGLAVTGTILAIGTILWEPLRGFAQ